MEISYLGSPFSFFSLKSTFFMNNDVLFSQSVFNLLKGYDFPDISVIFLEMKKVKNMKKVTIFPT